MEVYKYTIQIHTKCEKYTCTTLKWNIKLVEDIGTSRIYIQTVKGWWVVRVDVLVLKIVAIGASIDRLCC